jgi:TolB-like protein/DNA-binding winged helix-turn-helix (wHTH) protein/Tfp pilus assembly protein PilF
MQDPAATYRFGKFTLQTGDRRLSSDGHEIYLRPKTYDTLLYLLERQGHLVTKNELLDALWSDVAVTENALTRCIKETRAALGDDVQNPEFLRTIPRLGYEFIAEVERFGEPVNVGEEVLQEFRAVRLVTTEEDSDGHPHEPVTAGNTAAVPVPPGLLPLAARSRWTIIGGWLAGFVLVSLVVSLAVNFPKLRDRLLGRGSSPRITSLAVLPLQNLTGDNSQDYFVDGMTEELITELSKVHALRVISRQSVMQYKGGNRTVPQIARELDVDAVVEGSVLRAGDRVRITTQLVQARPERHLWSESYERKLSDVIALQHEVAQVIVREIGVSLTPPEQLHLAKANPVSPEAYEAYLRGQYFFNKRSPDGLKSSLDFFRQAISKDPGYAPAYVGLADSYLILGDRNVLPPDEAYPKALPLVRKALALDDTLAGAHTSLAALLQINWDWTGAEREFRRAIDLDPGDALAHSWYGDFLIMMGRFEEALAENQRAHHLDPNSLIINAALASRFIYAGRYDEALEQAKASVEMDGNFAPARFTLGLAYTKKGMAEEAVAELKRALALSQGNQGYLAGLAYSYAVFGQTTEACRVAEHMKHVASQTYVRPSDLATAYVACGRNQEALRWLDKAYREHDAFLCYMNTDIMLEKLRPDPRFQELVRRMNFSQ